MAEWQRSADIPYPQSWFEFTVFNPVLNQIQIFTIMDIPEDVHDTVINFFQKQISADEVSIVEREAFLRMVLKQRLSLMCVLKQTVGNQVIVAVRINARRSPIDIQPEFKGKLMKWIWSTRECVYRNGCFFQDFNVSEAIIPVCAYTSPNVNATIVSINMLRCRGILCQATGIKLSLTCCSIGDIQNNKLEPAIEAGYKDYLQIPYEEVASIDTTQRLPECAFFKVMYNFYE